MTYSQYIEEVKKKLDRLNQASGSVKNENIYSNNQGDPSFDVFDVLGKNGMAWMEKQKNDQNK
jgi:hypothetical protein